MSEEVVTAQRAGFMSRFTAFVLDAVILTVALRGATWFVVASDKTLRGFHHLIDPAAIIRALVPALVAVYLTMFWRLFGQTPGKWLMGLKVVRPGGGPLTFGRALLRCAGYLLSALPAYAGFIWILGPRRRGWHDQIAGTQVVYVRRRPVEGARALARAPSA
ncbi:MAG TPA: RDD family protein [Polyangia bacterium]|nr:RDD family protein [Polyangia bacterium]